MDELSKSCRGCLKRAEHFTHYIYKHISPKQYSYCTSIEVKHNDRLPKALCDNCFKQINEFTEFKSKCMRSETKLLQLLRGLKDETTSELGIKYNNENLVATEVKSENRQNATGTKSYFKSEIDDAEENVAEDVLSDSHFGDTDDLKTKIEIEINDAKEVRAEDVLNCSYFDNTDDLKTEIDDDKDGTGQGKIFKDDHHDGPLTDFSETTVDHVATRVSVTNPGKSGILKRWKYSCEQCNKKFVYEKQLENHIVQVHNKYDENTSLECETCKKTFTSRTTLHFHIKRSHMQYSFKDVTCQICSKVCKTPVTLRRHQKTHEKIQPRVCDECGMVLKNDTTFKNHLETHIKNRKRDYPCSYCDKMYINKQSCSKHIARRHSTKQFICGYCDFVFTEKAYLVRHIMLHEGTHPKYKCDICSKSLTSRTYLQVHKRKHTGEKPFGCKHCSKSFSNRMRLVEHERVHTGEKPYECVVCAQRFSRRGSRNRHMKVHSTWKDCKQRNPSGMMEGNTMTP